MARVACSAALLLAGTAHCDTRADAQASATPISKVLDMLRDMMAKGHASKNEEEKRFTAFSQWCADQTRVKDSEIKSGKEAIDMTQAEIEKATTLIKSLGSRTLELQEDIGRWQKDQTSATDVRGKEAADYQATANDHTETIQALDDAIIVLKKQATDTPQTELLQKSLLQVKDLPLVPIAAKKALSNFLQQPVMDAMPDDQLFNQAPEANAYEFQSGGVLDMLEKLKDQFGTKKYELDKEELQSKHAYEQIMQQLTDNIENAEHEVSRKTQDRTESEQEKADLEGNLAQTTADLKEDQEYRTDMAAMCSTRKADFESRSKMRSEELAAIQQAIDIISSQSVEGAGDKHLPSMMQIRKRRGAALIQRRGGTEMNPLQERIATFLAERAQKLDSKLLTMISERVAVDPFSKVKKMVKDLIWKLMEEATTETEHKGWCDTELGTNKQTRDQKSEAVSKLKNDIEGLTSEIAQLDQDMQDLSSALSELAAAVAKATQDRQVSKAANEQAIQDAKDAQHAVSSAIRVIKDYYAKSAEATALVQQHTEGRQIARKGTRQSPEEDAPMTFDAPYKGMLPEGGNVVDFLEVILADFARLESETTTAEDTEVQEYKKFMFESQKDQALKENEREHKEAKKVDKESAFHETNAELKATQEALDMAQTYYEKLKPTCVDSGATYEDRVSRRNEEIQSLKEAMEILQGTSIDLN